MNVGSLGRTLRKVNATYEMLSLGVDDEGNQFEIGFDAVKSVKLGKEHWCNTLDEGRQVFQWRNENKQHEFGMETTEREESGSKW